MACRVAVIGAGCSGLACIKCCLDEGLEPVCFESSDDIGGLWRFKEKPEAGQANIYRSVIINTSKEIMSYSDFPVPAQFPNYMHNSRLLEYFHLYAEHFQLRPHIRFQTHVLSVKQCPDFSHSGQWEVVTASKDGQEVYIFDRVLVCTGVYTHPHLPLNDFAGIETFEGKYLHSWEYRHPEDFQGKRVVVIGIGNSGGDIAVELSRAAKQVYLSTRRGTWLASRFGDNGLPKDMVSSTRLAALLVRYLPSLMNWAVERKLNQRFDHCLYGLQPLHSFYRQNPMTNDELPSRIISGELVVKPNVREFRGSSLVFEDGTVETEIDSVIFATGYSYEFPFLPASLVSHQRGLRPALYKHVFPPRLEHPTLAVVGCLNTTEAIIPLSEMQARWATRVFAGLVKLPPEKTMLEDIEKTVREMEQKYTCSERGPLQVDYIPYLDSLAAQIGARPSLMGLLLRDPRLGLSVLLGPCTPYQYRLSGPGQWAGARSAILTQWERVEEPLRTRRAPHRPRGPGLALALKVSAAALLLSAAVVYIRGDPPALLRRLSVLPGAWTL
ncbi:flavin-containing monooxygenase 5-like [Lepisosteus oculatus]|uniref:flavin-containing monooxygenase 5-like n=1 Tax=Lepisosteus oculatus TaxID=7918 RepID=UPI0037191CEE